MIGKDKIRITITVPKKQNEQVEKLVKIKSKFKNINKSIVYVDAVNDYLNSTRS